MTWLLLLLPLTGSLVPTGGVIEAVLVIEPLAAAETSAMIAKVALPPGSSDTAAERLPVPDAGHEPELAEQVQAILLSVAGKVSFSVIPEAFEGPPLATVIV